MKLTPVLSANWGDDRPWTLDGYGEYAAARKALAMDPDAVISLVKESGLRGRGGAGFPTGNKWGFIPQGDGKPHYLVVNADGAAPQASPPFPAVEGLYARPTVIDNVESIASVPAIVDKGVEWFRGFGSEKSPGFTLYSLSGHVTRPGQYEAPLGVTLRELLDLAGGVREGHELKFWTPGGSSTPILTAEHLDVPLDFEAVGAAGSMLGTRALQIFDETTCVVRAVLRWTEFYAHESCGKCTPCREGTYWMVQILERLEKGEGDAQDITTLLDACDNILGRSFCALGDGATSPITSSVQYFKDEYVAHWEQRGCPFDPSAATLFASNGVAK